MNPCPISEQLPSYINDELFAAAQHQVEEHVESCLACQQELERLTLDNVSSMGSSVYAVSGRSESSPSSIDPLFVDRLRSEGPQGEIAVGENAAGEIATGEIAASQVEQPTPATPDQIGEYTILREIGRGGMGIVYEAEQYSLGRRVALKVLPRLSLFTKDVHDRFKREARAAAKMHHPNIVPVFEVGNEDGYFYYAMQLIQGPSLDHVIRELYDMRSNSKSAGFTATTEQRSTASSSSTGSTQPKAEALSDCWKDPNNSAGHKQYCRSVAKIAHQVAEALDYAHDRGVIHRDIKPSNLILDEEGVVWVTDFGLAKSDDEGMTQTGDFLGTLRYMSPERFTGVCDAQADIYALGVTLYELLVLRPVFVLTDRLQLIDSIHKVVPLTPRSIDRRIPVDLETIVLKACDKEPAARYGSAAELADDLSRFLNDVPILARRTSILGRFARWSRRNKALVTTLLAAVLISVLSIVGVMVSAGNQTGIERITSAPVPRPQGQPQQREIQVASELFSRGAVLYFTTDYDFLRVNTFSEIVQENGHILVADLTDVKQLEDSIALLKELPELQELWLRDAPLSEPSCHIIVGLKKLKTLELSGSELTDEKLNRLAQLPGLREVNVGRTQVTLEGTKRFLQARPKVAVIWHNKPQRGSPGLDEQRGLDGARLKDNL